MMIGPMEEMVVWREQPKGRRIAAWMKLVKMWAALRFSDAANMQVKTPKYYDGKMTADLHKAKTTGAGKGGRVFCPEEVAGGWIGPHQNHVERGGA